MNPAQKIYFLSDAHLGAPDHESSFERERFLTNFLEHIRGDASDIYLMGDIFDFWFEYKRVVPRGFIRFLGKLAELADSGIRLHYFTGNHDIWIEDYLPSQMNIRIHRKPATLTVSGKRFYLAHGDGLDESDRWFRFLKKVFTHPLLQWAFARLHPNFAFWLAHGWSGQSRIRHGDDPFKEEREPLIQYARKLLANREFDYFIFGHRHTPVDYSLNDRTRLILLGDWVTHFSYAVFDGQELKLETFVNP
ncbi:MAG: UDP-2,3-diacylglucosamine diphosphatase [Bacteroidales bacterium]|nr:UDP-2,3-diacylglucosamine diphosphatase [Bacteroidales bacterium]MDD2570999.1 UDP-2,3-diacylglucosamine diphosphatase [Bacteroidales bacterium]MDD2813527.1 UDP-2,3-diacylglucosamine diphosphatase [Bacteroidales bacterium]MDD3384517.1 UDP-2,3-diacylglucosamine diphosphatase [Bacteroidales bacterium]MDD3811633.1 UDP-2,3-diacylglucosamine diphosphatase [Bacteroidales bacterium]